MYCNQPYCGSGFGTGQYCSYDQIPQGINLAPTIVGEGEVTAVTLPDGGCQYYFKPTVKWWTPVTSNIDNLHTHLGVWYIKSITNSTPPYTSACLRQEAPRFYNGPDCNMNKVNLGYQLKFHNDGTTSTTDIHYFYPCLRQYDCTFNFPAKGCAAVQVNTPTVNTCRHDTICSKPCHCTNNDISEPSSRMSLDAKNKSSEDFCDCHSIDNFVKSGSNINQRQLLPRDERKKRIKLGKKVRKGPSKVNICRCPVSIDKSTVMHTDSGCGGGPGTHVGTQKQSRSSHETQQKLKHEWDAQKASHSKTNDTDCECKPPSLSDKCITTTEECNVTECERDIRSHECCNNGSKVINAKALIAENTDNKMETWCPISDMSKQSFECTQCKNNMEIK